MAQSRRDDALDELEVDIDILNIYKIIRAANIDEDNREVTSKMGKKTKKKKRPKHTN